MQLTQQGAGDAISRLDEFVVARRMKTNAFLEAVDEDIQLRVSGFRYAEVVTGRWGRFFHFLLFLIPWLRRRFGPFMRTCMSPSPGTVATATVVTVRWYVIADFASAEHEIEFDSPTTPPIERWEERGSQEFIYNDEPLTADFRFPTDFPEDELWRHALVAQWSVDRGADNPLIAPACVLRLA